MGITATTAIQAPDGAPTLVGGSLERRFGRFDRWRQAMGRVPAPREDLGPDRFPVAGRADPCQVAPSGVFFPLKYPRSLASARGLHGKPDTSKSSYREPRQSCALT